MCILIWNRINQHSSVPYLIRRYVCFRNINSRFTILPDVLNIVKDGNYGAENESGGWNGMVGELVRRVSVTYCLR